MCWAMATGLQDQEGVPENHLRRKLAALVRGIQWSYAIFWSISTGQQGMLEWVDGYYNGDIKTRKTLQPMELNADQQGLQRSEQLRDLYESLSAGDINQQPKRPSAALSPEDLTDSEWYYLVCMSFRFNQGQGLPGRTLANGHHIWLCNAHYAESKVFSRSLLAKSASIQTVVCFPVMGGVLELGATEPISEDITLIQHVTTSFLELPKPACSEQSTSSPRKADNGGDYNCTEFDHVIVNTMPPETLNLGQDYQIQSKGGQQAFPFPLHSVHKEEIELEELHANICEEIKTGSSDNSSNACGPNQNTEDSFMLDGLNGNSQVQSWQLMDDEFSNCLHGSVNSSDCISQSCANPENAICSPRGEKITNLCLQELQDCNHAKLSSLDLESDDMHYSKTLSAIFGNSHLLVVKPYFHTGSCGSGSSFTSWRKALDTLKQGISKPQELLKKILFDVPLMIGGSQKSLEEFGTKERVWKLEGDDLSVNHVLSERRRREKLNEKFVILRSLIPSINKLDKASILGNTIQYLKELERRVEELEACKESAGSDARERRKHPDILERTSDNYGNSIINGKKPSINKRKASDIDEVNTELNWVISKDGSADVTVTIVEKEVLIEMHCPWRDCLLFEVLDAISNLHLDAYSVQSSTVDGVLSLMLRSEFRGTAVASAGMIKQALQRVIS